MQITNHFDLGDIVFHKTDPDQYPMLVIQIIICLNGGIMYRCSVAGNEDNYYAGELTRNKVIDPMMN